MKILVTVMLFVCLGAGNVAFGLPKGLVPNFSKKEAKPSKLRSECVNFSGYWAGVCAFVSENGDVVQEPMDWTIVQDDCYSIDINNDWFHFDAIKEESSYNLGSYQLFDWYALVASYNEAGTVLNLDSVGAYYSQDDGWETSQGGGDMYIENDKLEYRFKEVGDGFEFSCTMTQNK